MKYKVGDKVRVRSDLEVGKQYGNSGIYFVSGMECYKGRIVTIQEITCYKTYMIEEDGVIYKWTDEMFEGEVEDMDIEINKMIDEKIEEFRKQLIEEAKKLVEEQKQKEEVFPKVRDIYWFVNDCGGVTDTRWDNYVIDNNRLAIGNVFKTEEEAEFALEKLEVIAELRKFAESKDRKWNVRDYHYFINWDCDQAEMFVDSNARWKHNEIYFESKEKAKEAIESVGEERIKKYYLEVKEYNEGE